jgi:precorrin-6A/cobalt-precorrin-6A reductase
MPMAEMRRLLILGGTTEAAALARIAVERGAGRLRVMTALAGRTERPGPLPGEVRIGGFGGADGLTRHLTNEGVDLLVVALHPFAERMAANARAAAERAGTPRLTLVRPMWPRDPRDRWIEVADIAGAADVLPRVGKRVWLTVGGQEVAAFAPLTDLFFLVRTIEPLAEPLARMIHIQARGPFTRAGEAHLIAKHRIDVLVTKASGGAATEAKIDAARACDLPVVMVRRPAPEPGPRVTSPEQAWDWIADRLDGSRAACALASGQ